MWPEEHHFTEYGFCASAALSLAAIARRARRIRLGTGVVVLPFNHPIRVAEDYAMLDLLSDGRVDLGVGRGYQPVEFQGFGIDQGRSREIFDEALEVIRRAWNEERFDFEGQHLRFRDVEVRPRPLQKRASWSGSSYSSTAPWSVGSPTSSRIASGRSGTSSASITCCAGPGSVASPRRRWRRTRSSCATR